MTPQGLAFLGLTALVAGLLGLLVFAALRFAAAARDARRSLRESSSETALLTAALQEALTTLRSQERAMAARAEASERLNTGIVGSLTSGLLVVGLDGIVRILNASAERLLGVPAPAAPTGYRALLGDDSPLGAVVEECLTTGQPIVRRAVQVVDRRGATLHLGVTASPLLDEARGTDGAICLFTDLTAVVDLEEQLRLKDTLARLGELTAGLAHEFRNGLATIHGYSRIVDISTLDEKQRQYVVGIRDETDSLGWIVTNFLNFARPAQLAVAPVDLEALVARVAEDVRHEATRRGGDVIVSGAFPGIDGDEVLLRQAFSNLARNAVEACGRAGVPPRITIDGTVDHDHRTVHVRMADNGPGIDPALREKVFRPFFTTRRDGTGLGLALVQKIVVTHNGKVTIGNAASGGASFDVTLPLAR
jgi:signal transduction histidine kinase/Sec-independent protein translocase protein TatA